MFTTEDAGSCTSSVTGLFAVSSFVRSYLFFLEVSCGSSVVSGEVCLLPFSSAPAYCPESADVEEKVGDGNQDMKIWERLKGQMSPP